MKRKKRFYLCTIKTPNPTVEFLLFFRGRILGFRDAPVATPVAEVLVRLRPPGSTVPATTPVTPVLSPS